MMEGLGVEVRKRALIGSQNLWLGAERRGRFSNFDGNELDEATRKNIEVSTQCLELLDLRMLCLGVFSGTFLSLLPCGSITRWGAKGGAIIGRSHGDSRNSKRHDSASV